MNVNNDYRYRIWNTATNIFNMMEDIDYYYEVGNGCPMCTIEEMIYTGNIMNRTHGIIGKKEILHTCSMCPYYEEACILKDVSMMVM